MAVKHGSQQPQSTDRTGAVLVGRSREQAFLRGTLEAATAGQGGLVLLAGEAGIGKTTLVRDLTAAAEARGFAVGEGRCYETGVPAAFAPWPALLAMLPVGAAGAADLPTPFGLGPAPQSAFQLMAEVAHFLKGAAAARPLLVILEDAHWANRDTLELLEVVTRFLERASLLIVATYRPDTLGRDRPLFDLLPSLHRDRPTTNLTLAPVGVTDAGLLVEALDGPCSPELAAYLHGRCDGHPLFLVELLRDLRERRLLPRDDAGRLLPPTHSVHVPALLRHLIAHRVARLGVESETLLAVAAVAGEEWELGVVEAVLAWDEEPLLRALEAALRTEMIVPAAGERYRFRHSLIREVLYEEQLARRRTRLHRRIGAILEETPLDRPGRDAALAYHYAAAEEWERAVRYGIAAGDAARQGLAGHGALAAYAQALAALEHASPATVTAVAVALHERIGQTQLLIGHLAAAEGAFDAMLAAARASDDHRGEGRALVWLSYLQRRRYHPTASRETGEAGLRVAVEVAEPQLLALAHWNLAHLNEIEGDLGRSAHHASEAERLARDGDETDSLRRSLQVQAILAVWNGRYRDAERVAGEALDLARAAHDGLAVAAAHWRLGLALGELGRYAAAWRTLLAGVDHAEKLGERYYQAKLLNSAGWLCNELGDVESARAWNMRALEVVRGSHGDRVTEAERYTLLNLATDELAAGHTETAASYLREVEPLLVQHDYGRIRYLNRFQLVRGELALAQDDPATALLAAREAASLATEKAMPKNLAKSRLLAGRASLAQGRARDAIEALEHGVALADALAHGSLRWHGRLWLGHALRAQRRDTTAAYGAAMAQVAALVRDLDDDRLRATFLAAPRVSELREALAAAEADRPAARPAGLSERELDVLRLLAQHQTDKEIAEALFLSPRTVGTHVANILLKLDVTNRREAATAAVNLGLA